MKIGILNIDTLKPEFVTAFGDYPQMFKERLHLIDNTIKVQAYHAHEGQYPKDIDEADAYIITGSKLSVYDDIPWINQLKEYIKVLHQAKKKLIGICFGHQLIAQALGGKVTKADIGWCVGVHTNTLNDNAKAYGINDASFELQSSHQDQVVALPAGAKVLASTPRCPIAMMAIENHILTVQGHIEFKTEFAAALIDMRRPIFGEELYHSAKLSLATPTQHKNVTQWIVDFIAKK